MREKLFSPKGEIFHWTEICSGQSQQTYFVKWYGDSAEGLLYVGTRGPSFVELKNIPDGVV